MCADRPDCDPAKLPRSLESWCGDPSATGRRTVLVRIAFSVDPQEASSRFRELGAEVESAGKGVISAVVTPGSLARISTLPWVVAIEEPLEYFPSAMTSG
jgi:hypothetical protein